MTHRPTDIRLADGGDLQITWDDSQTFRLSPQVIRATCPCATCREKRAAGPPPKDELTVLSPAETMPLSIRGMKPVGNYAYSIAFSDGHDTGIYTLEYLRQLCEQAAQGEADAAE